MFRSFIVFNVFRKNTYIFFKTQEKIVEDTIIKYDFFFLWMAVNSGCLLVGKR